MARWIVAALAGSAVVVASSSCERRSPVAPACTFQTTFSTTTFDASGGTGRATVTSAAGCAWTATSSAPWLTLSAASGEGNGAVTYVAAVVSEGVDRQATLTLAGQVKGIAQSGCAFEVSGDPGELDAAGATATLSIAAASSCEWTATSSVPWIAATPSSGHGAGSITLAAEKNESPSTRQASISVAMRTIAVAQRGRGCSYDASLSRTSFGVGGGAGTVNVRTDSSCAWDASNVPAWITLDANSARTGSGSVAFSVVANPDRLPRVGSISFGGAGTRTDLRIAQDGQQMCEFRVSPTSPEFGYLPHGGEVRVDTGAGCAWTATVDADWLGLASLAAFTGPGVLPYSLSNYPRVYGQDVRQGRIKVRWSTVSEGQNVLVTQAPDCVIGFVPSTFPPLPFDTFAAAGGHGGSEVIAESPFSCPWRVESHPDWIRMTFPLDGNYWRGDGNLGYDVLPNPGPPRTGAIVVSERSLVIRQGGS